MNDMVYLISYEINEQQYEYSSLKDAIKSYGDYQHPMETLWFVRVPENVSANDIFEKLRIHFQSARDHIYVMQVRDGILRHG